MDTYQELQSDEDTRKTTYSIDGDDPVLEALVAAFSAAGVDVMREDTPLRRWIEVDALERLLERADQDIRITTVIWGHLVEFTPQAITIHER